MCVSASVPVPVCLSTNLFAFQLINRLSFSCAQVPAVGGWQSVSSLWLVPLISPSSSPCAQYKVAVQSVHCFLRNGVPAEAAPEKEEAGGGESEASASSADDFLLEVVVVVCLSAGGGIYCLPVGARGKHLPRCVPIHFQSEYQETRKVKKNIFLFVSQEKCSIESELFEPDEDIHPLCASSPFSQQHLLISSPKSASSAVPLRRQDNFLTSSRCAPRPAIPTFAGARFTPRGMC